jgi:hypothetical protein
MTGRGPFYSTKIATQARSNLKTKETEEDLNK